MNSTKNNATDTYLTIIGTANGLFKDKGSRFLSFAFPIHNEAEARQHLEQLRKEYHDARHHCYAYVLGFDKSTFRAYDDNEPSGTAGKPILGQIQAKGLTNIMIIVVRYFGGTLLGTGGLVNAYRSAAQNVLIQAKVIEKQLRCRISLEFCANLMGDIMKILKDSQAEVLSQQFLENYLLQVAVRKNNYDILLNKLNTMKSIRAELLDIQ
jgi:uncharacterized YigZ family protein